MAASRLEYLFDAYVCNKHTEAEERELMGLLARSENENAVQELIRKVMSGPLPEMQMPDHKAALVLQNILEKNHAHPQISYTRSMLHPWMRVAAAAAVLMMIGAGYWFFSNTPSSKVNLAEKESPVRPILDRALLTMSNGKTIVLDKTQTTTLQLGGVKINKNGTQLIFARPTEADLKIPVSYSTLSTPPGSQYQVVLSDGSKVWLNSASSIRFPSRFDGAQRQVSLTGEAYFEVAKNKDMPFLVTSGTMSVSVLGTHFNINAYGDNGMVRTSLLEGSVRITSGGASNILKPGEQAVLDDHHEGIETTNANIEQVMAWKNGLFQFEGADIRTIMGEIGRWYDVQIVYAGKVPPRSFEGKIRRSARLEEVLQILELSKVRFALNGRKITVEQ